MIVLVYMYVHQPKSIRDKETFEVFRAEQVIRKTLQFPLIIKGPPGLSFTSRLVRFSV